MWTLPQEKKDRTEYSKMNSIGRVSENFRLLILFSFSKKNDGAVKTLKKWEKREEKLIKKVYLSRMQRKIYKNEKEIWE